MRIIGGEWRSRTLAQPDTRETRPMPDRVKAAIFSMLGAHYDQPGALPALRVADVFAGSGSMGLEALSRGAACCCFFERETAALVALEHNLETVGAGDRAEIVRRDAWRAATSSPRGEPFDLVFLDPPYRDSEDTSPGGAVRRYLGRLSEHPAAGCAVVLHHFRRSHFEWEGSEPWHVADARSFGSNAVTMFLRA